MEMLQVAVVSCILSAAAVEEPPIQVIGDRYSSKNLTSPFGPNVTDIRWKLEHNGMSEIANVKNGLVVYVDTSRYKLYNHGTILRIKNLTESGIYIIDVTLRNGTSKVQRFHLTVQEPTLTSPALTPEEVEKTNFFILVIIIAIIAVGVLAVGVWWWWWWRTCCNRSSTTSGQEEVNKPRHLLESISSYIRGKCKYCKRSSSSSGQEIPEHVAVEIHRDPSNESSEISSSLRAPPDTFSYDAPTEEEVEEENENLQEQDELIEKNHIDEPMP